jgi:hypothetical protein
MKSKLKKNLRRLFVESAVQIDPAFSLDQKFAEHPHLIALRRPARANGWQFIAMTFSALDNRFYIEVATSRREAFPIETTPLGPDSEALDGTLRFRAAELWGQRQSSGWCIVEDRDKIRSDTIVASEGVFKSPEDAITDVVVRLRKWILPYFVAADRNLER